MKRAFWGILITTTMPLSLRADDGVSIPWANKFFAPKDPPPIVVHDFGNVPFGTTLTHRFPVTNIYAVPMQITRDPAVSCGCTRIVRYTQKLEPRETGFVDIEMDGRRFQGAKAVTISVEFGPKFRSTAILQVRAFARTDVSLTPGRLDFGVVALGQQPVKTVDVEYRGNQLNWQITEVDASSASNVKVAVQRVAAGRGAASYQLTASLKPNANPGMMQDQIILKTNDANGPVLTIPVAGTVQAPLTIVQGNPVRLDPVQVGGQTDRIVMVRSSKRFRIVKVEGEGDGLTVSYDSVSLEIQRLKITFKPTQPGMLQRKLTIISDQKDVATAIIEGVAEPASP